MVEDPSLIKEMLTKELRDRGRGQREREEGKRGRGKKARKQLM